MVEKMRPWNRTQVWQLAPEVLDRPRAHRLVGVFQTRRQMGNLRMLLTNPHHHRFCGSGSTVTRLQSNNGPQGFRWLEDLGLRVRDFRLCESCIV